MGYYLKLGILGSGKGSNCASILDAIHAGTLDAKVCVILTDNPEAGILDLARRNNIRAEIIPTGTFKSRLAPEAEQQVAAILQQEQIDFVVLAGYMRMVKAPLLDAFPRRILNIHPSLLPAFPGLEAWHQALEGGAKTTGCTVHYVDAGMDTGPIIAQAEVPVRTDDTAASLHARIQVEEHKLYPQVLRDLQGMKKDRSKR